MLHVARKSVRFLDLRYSTPLWYIVHIAHAFPHIIQSTLEQARAIKQQGNELYKQQKFEEAIKCYKEAIQVCPADKKEDLAIFHQNLAAVYDMLVR